MTFDPKVVAMVVGSPIVHSLSPAMHNAEFARRGDSGRYAAHEVMSGGLADFVNSIRGGNVVGLSVTMPLKEEAFSLVDRCDTAATRCASVNTLAIDGQSLVGYNTDGDGCVHALQASGRTVHGSSCVVVGAGGAGRAVVEAFGRHGARDVAVVNRSLEQAKRAAACADVGRVGESADLEGADFVVNTTPLGMKGVAENELPVDPAAIRADSVVLDAVYSPLVTPLIRSLRSRGVECVDGLWMLVHQAVLQQRIWFGVDADAQVMRAAAEAELGRR